jgi:3-oxoacyl-[acyl-carrier protein] reductase
MSDRYQQLIDNPVGKVVAKQIGLPTPVKLDRYEPGEPIIDGPILLGAPSGARIGPAVADVLAAIGAEVYEPGAAPAEERFKALILDATTITSSDQLEQAWAFFHPVIRRVRRSGRMIVLGTRPESCDQPAEAIAQQALEGLMRSIGKEVRRGATAQLIYVEPGAEAAIESTLRFFLSPRSAYVSGQVVRIGAGPGAVTPEDWEQPLAGKVALVTGASRGIGAAIAGVLARDGADVLAVDVPGQECDLAGVANATGDSWLAVDITDSDGPARIAEHALEHHGGVDVVVHNAGVTRDKTMGRMTEDQWNLVIDVNLTAPERIDKELFGRKVLREPGRIVCVSSISGIAGNAGQTNYATSKAGVIGFVRAWAPAVAKQGATVNAVAPGFIETRMTAAMPLATREVGRRMNSLSQGGLPIDVAETIAWLASPGSGAVNGNVVRVCGQSLLGA